MAAVKHLYTGHGNPNDNPALALTGDAVGNHLYQDLNDSWGVWLSTFYEDEGQIRHNGWQRMVLPPNISLVQVEFNGPSFDGHVGYSYDTGDLYIGMYDDNDGGILKWRSMGTSLGDWYQEGLP